MTRLFSRRAFHSLVWSYPQEKLAEQLGIPAYRISNLCRWHVIPMPGARYWARVEAGLPPRKTPLKPLGKGITDMVDIDCRMQPPGTYAHHVISDQKRQNTLRDRQNRTSKTQEENTP